MGGKTMNNLVDRDRELPANKRDLTHVPGAGELSIHHHHIFSKTGTASSHSKSGMAAYQGGVVSGGVGEPKKGPNPNVLAYSKNP